MARGPRKHQNVIRRKTALVQTHRCFQCFFLSDFLVVLPCSAQRRGIAFLWVTLMSDMTVVNFRSMCVESKKYLEPTAMECGTACVDLSWNHCTSTQTNGSAERAVHGVKEGNICSTCAIGFGSKLVGWFRVVLLLSAKRSRPLIGCEKTSRTAFWNHSPGQQLFLDR